VTQKRGNTVGFGDQSVVLESEQKVRPTDAQVGNDATLVTSGKRGVEEEIRECLGGDLVSPPQVTLSRRWETVPLGTRTHRCGESIASMWGRHCLLLSLQPLSASNPKDGRYDSPRKNRRRGTHRLDKRKRQTMFRRRKGIISL